MEPAVGFREIPGLVAILAVLGFIGAYFYMAGSNWGSFRNSELPWGERLAALVLVVFGAFMALGIAAWLFL